MRIECEKWNAGSRFLDNWAFKNIIDQHIDGIIQSHIMCNFLKLISVLNDYLCASNFICQ